MLVYVVFFATLLCVIKLKLTENLKLNLLYSSLIFSTYIVLLTELLSFNTTLSAVYILPAWCLTLLPAVMYIQHKRKGFIESIKQFAIGARLYYKKITLYEKGGFMLFAIMVILIFTQGVLYPPNNWDSLTYHLPRIMYWLSNQNTDFFPTHVLRNLYQPPFTEYFIMHVNVVNGNDYLANSIQLFFLVLTALSAWLVLDCFKVTRLIKIICAILIVSIPSVELQASTTKNDIVCAFFVVTGIYFCINAYRSVNVVNYFFLGLTVGLGILTKGTSYIFMAPILVMFAALSLFKIILLRSYTIIYYGCITISLVALLNFNHYKRNYAVSGNILNVDKYESESYSIQKNSLATFNSNLLKNAGLHISYPLDKIYDPWLREYHKKNHIDINSPDLNYYGTPYNGAISASTHEDTVPNFLHFILISLGILFLTIYCMFRFRTALHLVIILVVLLMQIMLFNFYLKWQPWHTRLHIPLFVVGSVMICLAAYASKYFRFIVFLFLPFVLLNFFFLFTYNNLRPIVKNLTYTKNIDLNDSRFKKYFANQLHLYPEYNAVLKMIYRDNVNKLGLQLPEWEYPLLHSYYYERVRVKAINVNNITSGIGNANFPVEAVVANVNTDYILVNGIKLNNLTPNNSHIYYYRKK